MLTVDNATDFLIEQRLINKKEIINGALNITSVTRRNNNLRINTKSSGNYLLKQPNELDFVAAHTLRREAAFYSFCSNESDITNLKNLLPKIVYINYERALLMLELLQDVTPLWQYYENCMAVNFPMATAAAIGKALGILHRTFNDPSWFEDVKLSFLPKEFPWIMRVHQPHPYFLVEISAANYQLIQTLQRDQELIRRLDNLPKLWQLETLIHGDIRMDNILVARKSSVPPDENNKTVDDKVYLTDWELVQFGDPAWDLAGVLQDFIFFWVSSMPHNIPPQEMIEKSRFPIPVLQQAIRTLWRNYCTTRKLTPLEADKILYRAVNFSAARIIQTAYELAAKRQVLPAPSLLLLQIGANLLADPESGQVQLYGIYREVNI